MNGVYTRKLMYLSLIHISSVFGAGASMWNTLTFGGFNKLFGIGGNAKEVQDSINRLTDRNETYRLLSNH